MKTSGSNATPARGTLTFGPQARLMEHVDEAKTAFEKLGRRWLGLGNIAAPVWFIGQEPGGTPRQEWPEIWASRYAEGEVIHGRTESADARHAEWFLPNSRLQNTWGPLIRLRLAYAGLATDDLACAEYQRSTFLDGNGSEAVLELSAYAAKGLRIDVPRKKYMAIRVQRIGELLDEYRPEIVVCYGLSNRREFSRICGGTFDENGLRWRGDTLCALTLHPMPQFKAKLPPEFWIRLGQTMRERVDERRRERSRAT
jgi:hypothetical protein